ECWGRTAVPEFVGGLFFAGGAKQQEELKANRVNRRAKVRVTNESYFTWLELRTCSIIRLHQVCRSPGKLRLPNFGQVQKSIRVCTASSFVAQYQCIFGEPNP